MVSRAPCNPPYLGDGSANCQFLITLGTDSELLYEIRCALRSDLLGSGLEALDEVLTTGVHVFVGSHETGSIEELWGTSSARLLVDGNEHR